MERRTYATIFLLVLGIMGVYSDPYSESHPTDAELSAFVDDQQPGLSLQDIPLGQDDRERIKRDDKDRIKPPNNDKDMKLLNLRRIAPEVDFRAQTIAAMVRARQATPAQLTAIVDSYMRQYNESRERATRRFRSEHPTLTSQYLPRST